MNATSSQPQSESHWPHRLAVALVCATFPLIWVGGLVTSYKAGMAVPDWPTTYGYNLFLYPWQTWILGPWDLFIEHGHRLLASAVGMLTIALVFAAWRKDRRRWLRWLSVIALAAVIAQGVLGGLRVIEDKVLLAKIHGCFGPAFFALTVAIAVFTSRRWQSGERPRADASAAGLQAWSLATVILAYAQLVLGAQLRHLSTASSPDTFRVALWLHLIVAAALVVNIISVATQVLRWHRSEPWLVRPAAALPVLVAMQLALGSATWIAKYGWPAWFADRAWAAGYVVQADSRLQTLVTTGHVAVGSLILATSLLILLRSFRLLALPARTMRPEPAMMEAAR